MSLLPRLRHGRTIFAARGFLAGAGVSFRRPRFRMGGAATRTGHEGGGLDFPAPAPYVAPVSRKGGR